MQDLKDIGFYTLSNDRVANASIKSPLWRCELLITSKCNFKCPYCRGTDNSADITFEKALEILDLWCDNGLKNVRFSGGEPTRIPWLRNLITHARDRGVERIAISTNGSAPFCLYEDLIERGCNDISISLDACCASFGDKMAGVEGVWNRVAENIAELSKLTYVTTGCVFNEENVEQSVQTIVFAHELGVADIRILTSAQYNKSLDFVNQIPAEIVNSHPILKYRVNNFKNGRNVRGLSETDNKSCPLVLDDMAIKGNHHYPCIIYMRELGKPIGEVNSSFRLDREHWYYNHNCYEDLICRENCLDVCVDYNNLFFTQINK